MTKKRQKARKQRPGSQARTSPRRAARPASRNERVLRERILKFTYQQRFKADMDRAIRLYFGEDALQDGALVLDEAQIPGFQEWYIHDYITSEGERIIDLFAGDRGPRLPTAQRQILDDWRRINRCRLFEVQEVEPGIGVVVQDSLSGEVLQVQEGVLYPALHRIQRKGWVDAHWGNTDTGRRAKFYTLTEAGRAHLKAESVRLTAYSEAVLAILNGAAG